jgi:hypothetical protein
MLLGGGRSTVSQTIGIIRCYLMPPREVNCSSSTPPPLSSASFINHNHHYQD